MTASIDTDRDKISVAQRDEITVTQRDLVPITSATPLVSPVVEPLNTAFAVWHLYQS